MDSAPIVAVVLGIVGATVTLGGILWRMASAMERTRLMVERNESDIKRIDGERVSQRVCSERMHGLRRDLTQQSMIHHLGGVPPAPGTQGDG